MKENLFKRHLREAILSLAMEPEDWEIDKYDAVNVRRSIRIWHCTRYFGTSLQVGLTKRYGESLITYGGVTAFSTFFGWATWRRKLCKAVDDCVKQQAWNREEDRLAGLRTR